MHEAAIAEALLGQVRTLVPAGAQLLSLRVDVGELEHIDPEVLAAAWEGLTPAGEEGHGARLDVERIALRVRCAACGAESRPEDPAILVCTVCGAVRPEVLAGSGIILRSLEVEEQ